VGERVVHVPGSHRNRSRPALLIRSGRVDVRKVLSHEYPRLEMGRYERVIGTKDKQREREPQRKAPPMEGPGIDSKPLMDVERKQVDAMAAHIEDHFTAKLNIELSDERVLVRSELVKIVLVLGAGWRVDVTGVMVEVNKP
jgi:hypothetical protein